jgi:hypothetical protein
MTATPNALAKSKANPLHQQIVKALDQTRPTSWTHKAIDPESEDPRKPRIIETKVAGVELSNGLARNVSAENVERIAERFAKAAR